MAETRGRHKVFLGMAAGVGKTYRMLQEGNAERVAGRDVVIGYLEPHGRVETERQVGSLERLPPRQVVQRELTLAEMDLPAILLRQPELCLIDELAHTNPEGLEHAKRWEDVEAVLDAGINVYSTVNVQHLESLNDQIAELTGVKVRETLPERVLASASEVVLIDITPEALVERLREGKIYRGERAEAALEGFFTVENLKRLRETALRQVAESVGESRLTRERVGTRQHVHEDISRAVGERLMALVTPRASSQRLVRRAWRSARRLGSELDLLWVRPPNRPPSDDEERQIRALRKLASMLGANVLIEDGEDVAEVAAKVAGERGVTYLLLGRPEVRRGAGRLRETLIERLMRKMPGVDIRLVAERTLLESDELEAKRRAWKEGRR